MRRYVDGKGMDCGYVARVKVVNADGMPVMTDA